MRRALGDRDATQSRHRDGDAQRTLDRLIPTQQGAKACANWPQAARSEHDDIGLRYVCGEIDVELSSRGDMAATQREPYPIEFQLSN
jgi:hypothetical protein